MNTKLSLKKEQEKLHNINTNYILETNVLSKDMCKKLIKYINLFKRKNLGRMGKTENKLISKKVSKIWKDSYDTYITNDILLNESKEFQKLFRSLYQIIFYHTHYYLTFAGLYGVQNIGMSLEDFSSNKNKSFSRDIIWEHICFRKYSKNSGYNKIHCDKPIGSNRILAGIIYLNDLDDGNTVFPVLNHKIKPKTGKLALFPSSFTHLHYAEDSSKYKYCIVFHTREITDVLNGTTVPPALIKGD